MAFWATVAYSKSGEPLLFIPGRTDVKELDQSADAHVVPCTVENDVVMFNVHEFKRDCACHPEVRNNDGQTIVIHTERVN